MENKSKFVDIFTGNTREGKAFWALISVPPENVDSYLHVSRSGVNFNLAQYGEVLRTGWGRAIPNDIAPFLAQHGIHLELDPRLDEINSTPHISHAKH